MSGIPTLEQRMKSSNYMMITFNDGSFPVISFHDTIEDAKSNLAYVQHWLIKDLKKDEIVEQTD